MSGDLNISSLTSGALPDRPLPLGSQEWIAAFTAVQGAAGPGAEEPGATANVALRGAPRSAEVTSFRVGLDDQGRMALTELPSGEEVDAVVDWPDILELSGLTIPEAMARGSLLRPKVLRRPTEDSLRLAWGRLAGYSTSEVRVPDFARFTLDA